MVGVNGESVEDVLLVVFGARVSFRQSVVRALGADQSTRCKATKPYLCLVTLAVPTDHSLILSSTDLGKPVHFSL